MKKIKLINESNSNNNFRIKKTSIGKAKKNSQKSFGRGYRQLRF